MHSTCAWLLSLILCWELPSPHTTLSYAQAVYYVTPQADTKCPGEPCLTINEYAQENHFDGNDDIILLFLSGEHNLTTQNFEIQNRNSLEMSPLQDKVVIQVFHETSVKIRDVIRVNVTKLYFTSEAVQSVCLSTVSTSLLSVSFVSIVSCELSLQGEAFINVTNLYTFQSLVTVLLNEGGRNVIIRNSNFNFYSTLAINDNSESSIIGDIEMTLESSTFNYSHIQLSTGAQTLHKLYLLILNTVLFGSGGNDGITINIGDHSNGQVKINIQGCTIVNSANGIQFTGTFSVFSYLNTAEIIVDQCYIGNNEHYGLSAQSSGSTDISVTSTIFSGNTVRQASFEGLANVTMFNCTLRGASTLLNNIGAMFNLDGDCNTSSLFINLTQSVIQNNKDAIDFTISRCTCEATISDTIFEQNRNGIVVVNDYYNTGSYAIFINNSCFQENTQVSLGVVKYQPAIASTCSIRIRNVTFFNNSNILPNSGIIQVDESISLSIEDHCRFRANKGTPVHALNATVTLSGKVLFQDNIAIQGGAISLTLSLLRIQSINKANTSIVFSNNKATITGGGIYVDQSEVVDSYSGSGCFYVIEHDDSELVHSSNNTALELSFSHNTASIGGLDIYGATPNSRCPIELETGNSTNSSHLMFKTSSNLSSISSDQKRVCLCDSSSQLMCANLSHIFYNTTRYPGETFPLSLALVGFNFGTVSGPVYAKLLPQANNFPSTIETDQYVRGITHNNCTKLDFTVTSLNSQETIVLSSNDTLFTELVNSQDISHVINSFNKDPDHVIPYTLLTVPVYINVALVECPPGFQRIDPGKCECNAVLREFSDNNCSIYNHKPQILHKGKDWISASVNSDKIVIGRRCPYNYCKDGTFLLNINNPNEQCNLGRSGILCGACPENLSLAIGSWSCLECNEYYHLFLLIFFAAAGILLVFFVKVLDMTVTTGAINGLIFYANIVWANEIVLFPPQGETSPLLGFLRTFIAWLNLDLGIETCFIPGLDGYSKVWLQFIFPAYVLLIAGLTILVSHYSERAKRLLGNNSVSALATLFLLSYSKLFFTVLLVSESTSIERYDKSGDSSTEIVWSFDGNVPFFNLGHSILFVVVIIILLVFWLPYTFVLFFIQCLRGQSKRVFLRWVPKLDPFVDSYLGPLKDEHHYWIGLGLFARVLLILTSADAAIISVSSVSTAILLVTITLLSLLVFNVYKQWQLSILESIFLVNLAIFSSGSLAVEIQGESRDSLACISLGITFVLFLAIVGYHTWRRLDLLRRVIAILRGYEDISANPQPQESPNSPQRPQRISHDNIDTKV